MGTEALPNVTLLEVTSAPQKIECTSPGDLPVGVWQYPSGDAIPEGSNPPVFAVYRSVSKIAELVVENPLSQEGIYTCVIEVDGLIRSSYFIGLYNSVSGGECMIGWFRYGLSRCNQ